MEEFSPFLLYYLAGKNMTNLNGWFHIHIWLFWFSHPWEDSNLTKTYHFAFSWLPPLKREKWPFISNDLNPFIKGYQCQICLKLAQSGSKSEKNMKLWKTWMLQPTAEDKLPVSSDLKISILEFSVLHGFLVVADRHRGRSDQNNTPPQKFHLCQKRKKKNWSPS
jgi:hypothetical protein